MRVNEISFGGGSTISRLLKPDLRVWLNFCLFTSTEIFSPAGIRGDVNVMKPSTSVVAFSYILPFTYVTTTLRSGIPAFVG